MQLVVADTLAGVDPAEWNALGAANPFLRHEFLSALERSGCAAPDTGWLAQHALVFDRPAGRLLAAAPMYLKTHSYGEYVFDWAWANAYGRAGRAYYPKLVIAVPFTPATGPRLLLGADTPPEAEEVLIQGVRRHAQTCKASSAHWLFTSKRETERLSAHGLLWRLGCQFHWENHGYKDFADFLARFASSKRNKVKRERRQVADAGIDFDVVTGADIAERHWDLFYDFYRATTVKYGAITYLSRVFFSEIGQSMAEQIVLIFARQGERVVAGALNFRSDDTFYGRYWGCHDDFHSLHFETCYYRPIEFCIERGLRRFEAGAQGEHKVSRGFLPTPVYSAHWLEDPQLGRAIAQAVAVEARRVTEYIAEMNRHSPYKNGR